jgi:hypothetical protein
MLEKYFSQPITRVALKRSAYGDFVTDPSGSNTLMYCRIRDFSESARFDPTNEEERMPEMQAWFSPNIVINRGDVFLYEGDYWEVVRAREARRGTRNDIEFYKVNLVKHVLVS